MFGDQCLGIRIVGTFDILILSSTSSGQYSSSFRVCGLERRIVGIGYIAQGSGFRV
jgi:hypothetical protein